MTLSGALMASSASERDAAEDFQKLEGQCTIAEAWVTRSEDRSGNDYKCWDYWEYRFCLPGLNSTCTPMYKSRQESIKVCDRRCSRCGDRTTPFFQVNERVECWEPAPGYEPGSPYDCRNPPCYKIFDPAGEATAAIELGAVLLAIGVVISSIVVAVVVAVWCYCMRKKAEAQQPAATQYASPGGGMQVAAMPVAQAMPVTAAQPVAIAMPVN